MSVEEAVQVIRDMDLQCQFLRMEPETRELEAAIVLLTAYESQEALVQAAIAWKIGRIGDGYRNAVVLAQAIDALTATENTPHG